MCKRLIFRWPKRIGKKKTWSTIALASRLPVDSTGMNANITHANLKYVFCWSASVAAAVVVDIFSCVLRQSKSHDEKEKLFQPNSLYVYAFACIMQASAIFPNNFISIQYFVVSLTCRCRRYILRFILLLCNFNLFAGVFRSLAIFLRCQLLLKCVFVGVVYDFSQEKCTPPDVTLSGNKSFRKSPLHMRCKQTKNMAQLHPMLFMGSDE